MQCSPAEIERKRQEALQKLAKKSTSPVKAEGKAQQFSFKPSSVVNQAKRVLSSNVNQPSSSSPFKARVQTTFTKHKPYEKANASLKSNSATFYGLSNTVTVSLSLISSERFVAKTSSYSATAIDIFKTIPSKNYDPTSREWTFHINDYDTLVSKLYGLKSSSFVLEPLPKFVVSCVRNQPPICDIDPNKLDPTLFQTLLPFQLEGLQFGVQRDGRCLIADDMGLGKTFQALAIMNYFKNDWPLLIVTTASMKNVWEETIFKYIPSVSIMQVQYMVSGKDFIGDSIVLIVSHDLMSRCCDKLLERGFGAIIIDESHNLKNYKTKMTQSAYKLCKNAKRVVLLSGTPALSRPKELYSQLQLIDEQFFGNFFNYGKRYCDMQQTNFGYDSSGKSNLQELEIILRKKFMIRRRKEDVLGMLPNKTQEVVKLNFNFDKLDSHDKEILEGLSNQYEKSNKGRDKHEILLTMFSETAKIKIPAVCAHVNKILESKQKFLLFAHHLVMLDAIEELLKRKNYKYIRIDGNSTGDQRKYFVDKFQTDEDCICALLSITAANAGITLTAASLVVFGELHWNPSILSQAESRVHRIGQESKVLVQYLLADGTADDHMWNLLLEKQNILSEMGLTKETFSNVNHKYQENNSCKTSESNGAYEGDDENMLDDGLDDVLCNIDI